MARAKPVNVLIDTPDQFLPDRVASVLKGEHGAHGLHFLGHSATTSEIDIDPDLILTRDQTTSELTFTYKNGDGETVLESFGNDDSSLRRTLSTFAIHRLHIPLEEQSSRPDYLGLDQFRGVRPNLEADPSTWIVGNPFVADLCRRFPQYGNLVRYACNERGLFLKVGNYPGQRAYWNSTTNGGLPIHKKSDPVHEGTFMLHDVFHFVPTDPVIGTEVLTGHLKSAYIAHRLLSEASTLVLADMVAVADARLGDAGYDISKRKIFPIYESILKSQRSAPDIDKLLAANAYFCFTGDPEGFKLLGASEEALINYRAKYESIFSDDFMWNLNNLEAMIDEKASNPRIAAYYHWLEEHTSFPKLAEYDRIIDSNTEGVDIAKMLSLFRADFKNALNYQQPLDDVKRVKLASQKYLAGQRIVFARFGDLLCPDEFLSIFDDSYMGLAETDDPVSLHDLAQKANQSIDAYLQALYEKGYLLPHELALYRFSAPLYPIRFVNYERSKQTSLSEKIAEFIALNQKQLGRLLEAAAA